MQRGCVSTLAASPKMARERSANQKSPRAAAIEANEEFIVRLKQIAGGIDGNTFAIALG